MNDEMKKLQQRVDDLEYQISFQEQTISDLNDALSQQQFVIAEMKDQMKFVVGKIKSISPNELADPSEETPPPHY
nr:SlyX family protein [Vibrio zhugei]